MSEKRYYWLKLKEDFFKSKRIKKLRQIAGGDTYTIIYLKMQLRSIKTNGYLTFEHVEKSFAEELALDLDEEVDNVQVVLTFLRDCDLIETSDNVTFFLPEVAENLGSECSSAERVRRLRERQNEERKMLQGNADVTELKRLCNVEKDIEKEKDKELEIKKKPTVKKKFADANEVVFPNDPLLDETFRQYVLMREAIKKPLTEYARTVEINKLNKLSGGDNEKAINILNQSITHNWLGLFDLKNNNTGKGKIDWDNL